ncbi:NADPH-dependent FMN reductase [Spongiivirga citrea]|uniref:NADPH-dependent FMN reductase n=1 Tax=Spongiivirga citrea TaxID=1481457 RepID=A0A6M0CEV1_9FLAO|nr:NAD(P)H-dependent oxidoreductase [Spongiivirga citrea]NER16355.1 NADPH-dependent FMN reductase [Spongiivirga citrea]
MASILAFNGSNSSKSINYELVKYASSLIQDHEVNLLKMSRYPFPMYSEDLEKSDGYLNSLIELKNDIVSADGLIISVNEHNTMLSAYFKNLIDWLSRIERKFLKDTKLLLLSTSPGQRGAQTALSLAKDVLPRFGAEIYDAFCLPSFNENFSMDSKSISNVELDDQLKTIVTGFSNQFSD